MFYRILFAAILLAFGSTAPTRAENATVNTDASKGAQQDKSATQPASKQTPTIERRNGVIYVVPKKPPPSNNATPPGRGGTLEQQNRPFAAPVFAANNARTFLEHDRSSDWQSDDAFAFVRIATGGLNLPTAPNEQLTRPLPNNLVVAQAVAKDNRYVVQFKPNVTPQQRNALLGKYGLVVQRELPSMNIVVVARRSPGNDPAPRDLKEAFNPPIIQSLRREPIVANATVDSAASPRSIPKPSTTKGKDDNGVTFQWDWKSRVPSTSNPSDLAASTNPPPPDGNWGLKAIRMPPLWTIVQSYRASNPGAVRPKLAIVDTGFSKHDDLAINLLPTPNIEGSTTVVASATTSGGDPCRRSHGNHVAGIAGAIYGNGVGVDGVMLADSASSNVQIDAVPVADNLLDDDPTTGSLTDNLGIRNAFYSEVLFAVASYVDTERAKNPNLRVVNISMGLNIGDFVRAGFGIDVVKAAIQDTLRGHAQMFATAVLKYEQTVLFVTAAGNDSDSLPAPLDAKWSSSLAWLARGEIDSFLKRPKNILIVEAMDRNGQRADFSNIGGHIAAPGVDILSTLSDGDEAYGVCSGTSQATPYAAGVATLLFELSPSKKPADIIDVMTKSAARKPAGMQGAPRLDALEATMKLSPYTDKRNEFLVRLADLNGDGKVDALDLKEFARQVTILGDNRANGTAFAEDLNGDGVTDANECNWPKIDLNGSGYASLSQADAKRVLGQYRNDLAVLQLAWTDATKDSATALKEAGLDVAVLAADKAPTAAPSPQACK